MKSKTDTKTAQQKTTTKQTVNTSQKQIADKKPQQVQKPKQQLKQSQKTQSAIKKQKSAEKSSNKIVTQDVKSNQNTTAVQPTKKVQKSGEKQPISARTSQQVSEKKIQKLTQQNNQTKKTTLDPPKRDLPKSKAITIKPYLEATFQQAINNGLKQLLKNQPEDPIKYLGQYLLQYSKSK